MRGTMMGDARRRDNAAGRSVGGVFHGKRGRIGSGGGFGAKIVYGDHERNAYDDAEFKGLKQKVHVIPPVVLGVSIPRF